MMKYNDRSNTKYNFIFERTSVVKNHDIKILEETDIGSGKSKIAARACLQESEVKNKNNRYYSSAICESIVNQLSPKASGRSLLMEIDHPLFVSSDPEVLKKRASIIEINNCAAMIREIDFKNNKISCVFETLSGLAFL